MVLVIAHGRLNSQTPRVMSSSTCASQTVAPKESTAEVATFMLTDPSGVYLIAEIPWDNGGPTLHFGTPPLNADAVAGLAWI